MVSSMCGNTLATGEEYQENCALPTVKHDGGSIMVLGCMTTAGTGELRFIEGNMDSNVYCDILKQKMMPSLQKQFSNITTTPNTPALLLKVKVMEWLSMSPDLNPVKHMWGILKRKVKKHNVSNIQQLRDVIMEAWKRIPAKTCAALVNSMNRRIKAVLDNNGAPTKYWHFGHSFDMFTKGVLIFVASYLDNLHIATLLVVPWDYKLHIDYSKIYPSFICAVLSLY